ncbi:hypothetical protein MK805_06675 [Shimazuella sp. AN120528]|nr:hypothetical protein [Shimazuella soli]
MLAKRSGFVEEAAKYKKI